MQLRAEGAGLGNIVARSTVGAVVGGTNDEREGAPRRETHTGRFGPLSSLEVGAAGLAAVVLAVLAALEPDILGAPFQSTEATAFTVGGTAIALVVLVVMLRLGVPPLARLLMLGVPFLVVNWWLLSPFFFDTMVDEEFEISIEDAAASAIDAAPAPDEPQGSADADDGAAGTQPAGPKLLGSGSFIGLAGHDGSGDAGIFRLEDGSQVLRLEKFAIDNGPDLKLYLVPGADQTQPADGSVNLGALRGNVGDQTYEIPAGSELQPGPWTALVWCEQFAVEFVAATLTVT